MFFKAGEGSQRNIKVVNAPSSKKFLEDPKAEKDSFRIVALGDLMPLTPGEFPSMHPHLAATLKEADLVFLFYGTKTLTPFFFRL